MAVQKIILFSYYYYYYYYYFIIIIIIIIIIPKQGYACASHILSKYLSNQTEILHTYVEVNVVISGGFWVSSVKGFWS